MELRFGKDKAVEANKDLRKLQDLPGSPKEDEARK